MSKYAKFGQQLDELAKNRFAEYELAKARLERAKKDLEKYPKKLRVDPIYDKDYMTERNKRAAKLQEAETEFAAAKKIYETTMSDAEAIRNDLFNELKEDLAVKPDELDRNTVDLLNSRICSAAEVARLFDEAETVTTQRFIANFAKSQITERTEPKERAIFNNVSNAGERLENPELTTPMRQFDAMADALKHCIRNPNVLGYWSELSEPILNQM